MLKELMHPYRNISGAFLYDLGQRFLHGSEIVCCCSISLGLLLENLFTRREIVIELDHLHPTIS